MKKTKKEIIVPTCVDIMQHFEKIVDKPEIRVWCHPDKKNKSGDDYYHIFSNVEEAFKYIKTHKNCEKTPLFAFNGYEYDLLNTKIVEKIEKKMR